jgi:protein-L-isoaspartate(D-aspartate) O-methyltransferase
MNLDAARQQMTGQQLRAWDVLDERVLETMGTLPREQFVPPGWQALAYADAAIPLAPGRQLAPPKLQGRALQALLPQPGDLALEIGSGTGYLTACLAALAGRVTGVESDAGLATLARSNLAAVGADNAEVLEGDGLTMEFADRFDVVCVNGSLPDDPGMLDRLRRLLKMGGRLFVVTGRPPIMQARRIMHAGESEWTDATVFETCLPPVAGAPETAEFEF